MIGDSLWISYLEKGTFENIRCSPKRPSGLVYRCGLKNDIFQRYLLGYISRG